MAQPHLFLVLQVSLLETARAAEREIRISRGGCSLSQRGDGAGCCACDNFIAGADNCWQVCKENWLSVSGVARCCLHTLQPCSKCALWSPAAWGCVPNPGLAEYSWLPCSGCAGTSLLLLVRARGSYPDLWTYAENCYLQHINSL